MKKTAQEELDQVKAELTGKFEERERFLAAHNKWREATIELKRRRDYLERVLELEKREAAIAAERADLGLPPPLSAHAETAHARLGAKDLPPRKG